VAAALAALAFLAHSGVATGLLAFGLVLLWPGFFPGWRNVLVAVAVIGALLLPWAAVVRYVAPPGNHIAKVHLAGVKMSERDARTTLQAMGDAYAALPFERLAEKKRAKLLFLLGSDPNRPPGDDFESFIHRLRRAQFLQVGPSLGVLNVGWLALAVGLTTGRRNRLLERALGVGCLGLLVWVGIFLSRPYVHVSSYATMLLLFTGLSYAILQLPLRFAVPILVTNAAVAATAILGAAEIASYAPVSLAVAAVAALGLLALLPLAGRFEDRGAV
jgi:MFS family permease